LTPQTRTGKPMPARNRASRQERIATRPARRSAARIRSSFFVSDRPFVPERLPRCEHMSILWPFPSLPSCLENSGCSWGWRRNWKPRAHREQRAFGAGLWGLTSGRRWHQSRIRSRATQTAAHGYVDLDRYYGLRPTVRVSGNALEAGNVAIAPVAMCQKRHQCHFIHYYVVVSPFKAQFKAKWLKRKGGAPVAAPRRVAKWNSLRSRLCCPLARFRAHHRAVAVQNQEFTVVRHPTPTVRPVSCGSRRI
jgi:hypothetical protein